MGAASFICTGLEGLYFAYGADMHAPRMSGRCRRPALVGSARLPGFRIGFFGWSREWDGAGAGLVPDPAAATWGVLYRLDAADWDRLDSWQDARLDGTGAYFHCPVRVTDAGGGERVCLAYQKSAHGPPLPPSREYLATLVEAARAHGLPDGYVAGLASTEAVPASYPVPRRPRCDRAQAAGAGCQGCGH